MKCMLQLCLYSGFVHKMNKNRNVFGEKAESQATIFYVTYKVPVELKSHFKATGESN